MSKPYTVLNSLSPDTFLHPDNFITDYDSLLENKEYKQEQYAHGLQISHDAETVIITENSTWAANMKNGSYLSSYEGIGYHSATSDLLRGFLDGPARIVVNRRDGTSTVIREAKK